MNVTINYEQSKKLVQLFGGEDANIVLVEVPKKNAHQWYEGEGLYAGFEACEDEGYVFLGLTK